MTNEEAINVLKVHKEFWGETVGEAMCLAIKALEQQHKTRWHDLRKDPEDLPGDRDKIICYYENRFAAVDYYEFGEYGSFGKVFSNIDDYDMDVWKVQAWKLLEPFTDDYIMPENSDHRKQRGRTAPNKGGDNA